jgi:hypothetical protein
MSRWQIAMTPVIVVTIGVMILRPDLAEDLVKMLLAFAVSISVLLGALLLGLWWRHPRNARPYDPTLSIAGKLPSWSFPSRLRASISIVQAVVTTTVVMVVDGAWGYVLGGVILAIFAAPKYLLSA